MGVRVDDPGDHGVPRQLEDPGIGRNGGVRPDRDDLIALDHHGRVFEDVAPFVHRNHAHAGQGDRRLGNVDLEVERQIRPRRLRITRQDLVHRLLEEG